MADAAPAGSASRSAQGVEAEDWDPLAASSAELQRRPSAASLRRLRGELAGLRSEPLPGVHVCPDAAVATLVHALVAGPSDTPYSGGLFHFVLDAPDNYPHSPPRVRLLTTGSGTVRFNPQFYASGKVCLSILHTWPGPGWQPTFTLRVVLLQLQALMNEMPALNEPGMMLMSDPEEYNDFLRHETLRVAVLGVAEEAALVVRAEEGIPATASSSSSSGSSAPASSAGVVGSGAGPRLAASPRLPVGLAYAALEHVARHAEQLEARCLAAAVATPEGTVLRGLPRPTRTKYVAMAAAFRGFKGVAPPEGAGGGEQVPASGDGVEPPVHQSGARPDGEGDVEAPAEREDRAESEVVEECRICGGGESDGELIRPCGCSGSIAFVHRHCAAEWIRRDGSPICPICRKAYNDPALRTMGAVVRCRRSCAELGRSVRHMVVLLGCYLFNEATGGGLQRVEVGSQKLRSWRLHSGPTETTEYRLRGTQLQPARTPMERWYSPLVEVVILRAETRWRERPLPVVLPFKTFSDLAMSRQKPSTLASLLNAWSRKVVMNQARQRHRKRKWVATIRGVVRSVFQRVSEPLPAMDLRLRPACAARVAATAVLFAWLALGKRSWIWLFMCCHVGFRFAPAPVVAAAVIGAQLAAHQVHRRLARLGMFRRRPAWEADLLLVSLLLVGTFCAGLGTSSITGDPEMPEDADHAAPWVALPWAALIAICVSATATVARPPDGRQGACARGAAVLHGLLWSLCGSLLCLLAATPMLFPAMTQQITSEVVGDL